MRSLFALVFVVGCGNSNPSSYTIPDGGASLDGHIDPVPGCMTACDCQPGLSCENGKCSAGTKTYCCEATTCPTGNACQSTNGTFGTCQPSGVNGSNGGTGGVSGGIIGGSSGGIPGFDFDAGFGGLIGGGTGGIPGFDLDGGLSGGLTGGLTGGTSGGDGGMSGGYCNLIPCSSDSICTSLGCTMCDSASGKCQ
jgi:hypothetical protein